MKKHIKQNGSEAPLQTVTKKYRVIKLGIDWHAREYRVVRLCDDQGPEKARRFTPEAFLRYVAEQQALAETVITCYEAGAGGFVLHRQLTALGVQNFVVHPRDLDREHKGVATDATDARELGDSLDRYVRGNKKALRPVYVPTPEEEQRRLQSRRRQSLSRERRRHAAQGGMLLLSQGYAGSNRWWQEREWARLQAQLPAWLCAALASSRRILLCIEAELSAYQQTLSQAAPKQRPKALGPLTLSELDREVCAWSRFSNAKKAGGYTGLCGSVHSSGPQRHEGGITKAGNARVRVILLELAWRFVRYQPQSELIQRWPVLTRAGSSSRQRKKAIVAVAHRLFIDLWRWRTGRATPAQLGWTMLG